MILSKKQIREIVLNNPTRDLWSAAVKDTNKLQAHVLGHGLRKYVETIEGYESGKAMAVRKQYCKSNRDLFARVLRPIDNIWNGRGGSKVFLTTEDRQKRMRAMLQDVSQEYSLQSWVEQFWLARYKDDPMGVIFMEVDPMNVANGAYPTYKSSREIYDALPNGRRLEYVFFKTKDPNVFRLVDDAQDVMVKLIPGNQNDKTDQGSVQVLNSTDNPRYINWFDRVPALIVSDIPYDGAPMRFMSPIQDEIELADQYLRDGSITNIYRFKHGFPRSWKYPEVCNKCKGTKLVEGRECLDCSGTGIALTGKPGDITVFAWPSKEESEIREKGGFISPDLDYLKYADESLAVLEETITRTHWGTDREAAKAKSGEKETATGRFIDTQPINNRLTKYAKAAESIEQFITNHIGYYAFNQAWKGCAINLGRRFMVEHPDEIWKKYEDSRKNGAPLSALDDLLRDYYETKYQANEMELQKYLVLAKLEPGVHLTIGEAKNNLPWIEYAKKVYFTPFINSLTDVQITGMPLSELEKQLEDYTIERMEQAPVDPKAPKLDENNNPIPVTTAAAQPAF